jgi:hypothetical protein
MQNATPDLETMLRTMSLADVLRFAVAHETLAAMVDESEPVAMTSDRPTRA